MLDARGHVDAGRARDTQCLGDVIGIEAAREHERHPGIDVFQEMPIEGFAQPARPRRLARRARIEQQAIGDAGVIRDHGEVASRRDRDRFHHRQTEALFQRRDSGRRLLAMKLQQVRRQSLDHALKKRIVGIDRQRHFQRAAANAFAERPRRIERQVARRRREEHESDHVGAGIERNI